MSELNLALLVILIGMIIFGLLDNLPEYRGKKARHSANLTERRSKTMFSFLKKKKPDQLQPLLDDLKKHIPRRMWQDVDDIRYVDTEHARRYLNRITSIYPETEEASGKIIDFLNKN